MTDSNPKVTRYNKGPQAAETKRTRRPSPEETARMRIKVPYRDTPQAWAEASCKNKVQVKEQREERSFRTQAQFENNKNFAGSSKDTKVQAEVSTGSRKSKPSQNNIASVDKESFVLEVNGNDFTPATRSFGGRSRGTKTTLKIGESFGKNTIIQTEKNSKKSKKEVPVENGTKNTGPTRVEGKVTNKKKGKLSRKGSKKNYMGTLLKENPQEWARVSAKPRSAIPASTKATNDNNEWKVQGRRRRKSPEKNKNKNLD